jgi:hypothetical protein
LFPHKNSKNQSPFARSDFFHHKKFLDARYSLTARDDLRESDHFFCTIAIVSDAIRLFVSQIQISPDSYPQTDPLRPSLAQRPTASFLTSVSQQSAWADSVVWLTPTSGFVVTCTSIVPTAPVSDGGSEGAAGRERINLPALIGISLSAIVVAAVAIVVLHIFRSRQSVTSETESEMSVQPTPPTSHLECGTYTSPLFTEISTDRLFLE